MAVLRFAGWAAAGVFFMLGLITPVGFFFWIPSAIVVGALIGLGVRTPRFMFAFASGIGITLISLGIINGTYIVMVLYGSVLTAGGIVAFSAFGPRTSRAEPPTPR